jgi:Flp pilus assembly pilin Flp
MGKGVTDMTKLFIAMYSRLTDVREREEGQTFAEYGVILAIIAVAMIVVLGFFKDDLAVAFNTVGDALNL